MVGRGWGNVRRLAYWNGPGHPDLGRYVLQEILFRFERCATAAPGSLTPVVVIVQIHKTEFQIMFSDGARNIFEQLKPSSLGVETGSIGKAPEAVNRCTVRG